LRRSTLILAGLTFTVLMLSLPSSLKYFRENHGLYLFSEAFVEDIPKRLLGPGRFRFILQPLVAIILGIRNGMSDARAGRPPYLWGVLFHRKLRGEFLKGGLGTLANIVLMGILVDSVCQWLILRDSYLGAALVVGPVLIVTPYTIARSLTNRAAKLRRQEMQDQVREGRTDP
jgi:hypothetical protein